MKPFVCYVILICLATACEYPVSEDNYIEVKKPEPTIYVSMDLNIFPNGESILINKPTELAYSFQSEKAASRIVFTIGDRTWETNLPNGALTINEGTFPNGTYTLKVQFFAPTGSGSIADQLSAEFYTGEMSWPVIIDYQMVLKNLVTYRINDDRLLELNWHAPVLSHLTLTSYRIQATTSRGDYDSKTVPANQTSFVDAHHIGFETTYQIYANLKYKEEEDLSWYIGEITVPENLPRLFTSDEDIEHVRINWELPYKCLIRLSIDGDDSFSPPTGDTSMLLPVTSFGRTENINVAMFIAPIDSPAENLYSNQISVPTRSPGCYYKNELASAWCYSPVTKMLYANSVSLNAYLYPQLDPIASISDLWAGIISPSSTEPLLATTNSGIIQIRDAWTLELKHELSVPLLREDGANNILTSDNKLIYVTYDYDYMQYKIILSTLDGNMISSARLDGYPSIFISPDGKHIAISNYSGMKVIELENDQFTNTYTLPIPIEKQGNVAFNPVDPSQLIIPGNHSIEIRHCHTYELIADIQLKDNMQYSSTDPVTGNLLISNNDKLSVLSATDHQEIFTVRARSYGLPTKIIGDYLINHDGYILNIKDSLSQ